MKKAKVYSLFDLTAGISMEDWEKLLEENKLREEENKAMSFDLQKLLDKYYKIEDKEGFSSCRHKYYKRLDELVLRAKLNDEEAIGAILAYAMHSYVPHAMLPKYKIWQTVSDEDDIVQIIAIATLDAIRKYEYDVNHFQNFAGFLKGWVTSSLKSAQTESAPIKISKKESEKNKITFISMDGYFNSTSEDGSFDVKDDENQYEEFEENEMSLVFKEKLLSLPNEYGKVLIILYGLDAPHGIGERRTLKETAKALNLSIKQVRTRAEKGMKAFKAMYPNFLSEYLYAV